VVKYLKALCVDEFYEVIAVLKRYSVVALEKELNVLENVLGHKGLCFLLNERLLFEVVEAD
jgi:hypothetical protein